MVCEPGYADEPYEVAEKCDIDRADVTVRDATPHERAKLAGERLLAARAGGNPDNVFGTML